MPLNVLFSKQQLARAKKAFDEIRKTYIFSQFDSINRGRELIAKEQQPAFAWFLHPRETLSQSMEAIYSSRLYQRIYGNPETAESLNTALLQTITVPSDNLLERYQENREEKTSHHTVSLDSTHIVDQNDFTGSI